jgi:hypothetical protein
VIVLASALLSAGGVAAQPVPVPSGLGVERLEVIWDEDLSIGRFRFLAGAIAAPGFDTRTLPEDLAYLCRTIALPETRATRPDWDEVVVSVSSAAIPFGVADPEVTQSFEAYRLDGEDCIWTPF